MSNRNALADNDGPYGPWEKFRGDNLCAEIPAPPSPPLPGGKQAPVKCTVVLEEIGPGEYAVSSIVSRDPRTRLGYGTILVSASVERDEPPGLNEAINDFMLVKRILDARKQSDAPEGKSQINALEQLLGTRERILSDIVMRDLDAHPEDANRINRLIECLPVDCDLVAVLHRRLLGMTNKVNPFAKGAAAIARWTETEASKKILSAPAVIEENTFCRIISSYGGGFCIELADNVKHCVNRQDGKLSRADIIDANMQETTAWGHGCALWTEPMIYPTLLDAITSRDIMIAAWQQAGKLPAGQHE